MQQPTQTPQPGTKIIYSAIQTALGLERIQNYQLHNANLADLCVLLAGLKQSALSRALATHSMQAIYSVILSQLPDEVRIMACRQLESAITDIERLAYSAEDTELKGKQLIRSYMMTIRKPDLIALYPERVQQEAAQIMVTFARVTLPNTTPNASSSPTGRELLSLGYLFDPTSAKATLVNCLGAHIQALATYTGGHQVNSATVARNSADLRTAQILLAGEAPNAPSQVNPDSILSKLRLGKFVTNEQEQSEEEEPLESPLSPERRLKEFDIFSIPEPSKRPAVDAAEIILTDPIAAAAAPLARSHSQPGPLPPIRIRRPTPEVVPNYLSLIERLFQMIGYKTNAQNSIDESALMLRAMQICWTQLIELIAAIPQADLQRRKDMMRDITERIVPRIPGVLRGEQQYVKVVESAMGAFRRVPWRRPSWQSASASEVEPALLFSAFCLIRDDLVTPNKTTSLLAPLIHMAANQLVFYSLHDVSEELQADLSPTLSWIYERRPSMISDAVLQSVVLMYTLAASTKKGTSKNIRA